MAQQEAETRSMVFAIYFGAAFSGLLAAGQLIKPWHKHNIFLSGLLVCLAYINLYIGFIANRFVLGHPHLLLTVIPFLYTIGPLAYIYLKIVTSVEFHWKRKYIFHFLPLIISFIIGVKYWILDEPQKLAIYESLYRGDAREYTTIPLAPGLFIVFAYLTAIFYENNPFIPTKNRYLWIIGALLIIWSIASLVGTISIFMGDLGYLYYAGVVITASVIYLFLLSHRYPDFLYTYGKAVRKKRYEKSVLKALNIKNLGENLRVLMADEKIFQEDNLTLKKAAEMLQIKPHQLSQYLNEVENVNFNTFVNRYRIDEAAQKILNEPDRKILTIAFDVGFNSLSVFNAAFQRQMGLSPTQFKKQNYE